MSNLPNILGITWRDHLISVDVLKRADTPSTEVKVTKAQLRWSGILVRVSNETSQGLLLYLERV